MTDSDIGDFYVSDSDEDLMREEEDFIRPPVLVPPPAPAEPTDVAASLPGYTAPSLNADARPVPDEAPAVVAPVEPTREPEADAVVEEPVAPVVAVPQVESEPVGRDVRVPSREARLATALRRLMEESQDIEAAALVSLDGFAMASALPEGMHEDRVGAMSAAILGLGERAAVELGKGKLSQVFIEGDGGYVLLIAAGDRAVLTCLADENAKLGLVLYDMRLAAQSIGEILG
jgi:hypothetical protein